jgi:hypothetical protein
MSNESVYPFLMRCNGYKTGVERMGDAELRIFNGVIDSAREHFRSLLPELRAAGERLETFERFHNDDRVRHRIESACACAEFVADPYPWVMDALRDCAEADHWYMYEKEWE